MKLLTEREKLTGDDFYFESMDRLEHDAACAHALMQAIEKLQSDWEQYGEPSPNSVLAIADELMAEWGFDNGEVE